MKYFIILLFLGSVVKADLCDPQWWRDATRADIDNILAQSDTSLDSSIQDVDVLYEDCENGEKPIEVASRELEHALIGHLLCKIAYDAVFNKGIAYLTEHFRTHGQAFDIGVYLRISLPEIGGIEGLTMQVSPPNCHIDIFQ